MIHAPPDEMRCTWTKSNGRRCGQPRSEDGGELCAHHAKWQEERLRRRELAQDAPDVPLDEHLRLELKISWTMVRMLELEVMDLGLDLDAFLHDTTETEERDGGPGGGFTSVKRARVLGAHPLILAYLAERQHHLVVVKLAIGAGIAARQIAAVERVVEQLIAVSTIVAEQLGHDPTTPETRRVIMDAMRKVEDNLRVPATAGPRVIEG